jgi:hypothetical protein
MEVHSLYNTYISFVDNILKNADLTNFKNDSRYTYMLEHVSNEYGQQYLNLIKEKFKIPDSDIIEFSIMNDIIGNPNKYKYLGVNISPTSLRYFFQAMLILTHFESKGQNNIRIVELGGGYGGLCLAINYCSKYFTSFKINEYNIIDLEAPTRLQRYYLSCHKLSYPIKTYVSDNFGTELAGGDDLCMISNYCFSEIDKTLQDKYISILFPKVKHGFITWNMIPIYDFGKICSVEDEYPKTGQYNYYVRF